MAGTPGQSAIKRHHGKGQPSLTALGAARLRAAHQVLDQASILTDPLAVRILGEDISVSLDHARAHPAGPRLRWFIAARSRIAEDALNVAVNAGTTQLVVLGAGLDTLTYRTPLAGRLRVFEVDHPATQQRKRQMLADAAIDVPNTLRFSYPSTSNKRRLRRPSVRRASTHRSALFSVGLASCPI